MTSFHSDTTTKIYEPGIYSYYENGEPKTPVFFDGKDWWTYGWDCPMQPSPEGRDNSYCFPEANLGELLIKAERRDPSKKKLTWDIPRKNNYDQSTNIEHKSLHGEPIG